MGASIVIDGIKEKTIPMICDGEKQSRGSEDGRQL